jgi:Zn-dependent protease with chaperone function
MKKVRIPPWRFNIVYVLVLCAFIYNWPYTVYQNIGHAMQFETAREKYISSKVTEYAKELGIKVKTNFRVGQVPSSAGALSGASVIIISPAMLDAMQFSDKDIQFVLAHEVGHLARYDAYRFWTTWRREWAERRESAADVIAVKLTGCDAMAEAIKNHGEEFMLGYLDHEDPHPHPFDRYSRACANRVQTR